MDKTYLLTYIPGIDSHLSHVLGGVFASVEDAERGLVGMVARDDLNDSIGGCFFRVYEMPLGMVITPFTESFVIASKGWIDWDGEICHDEWTFRPHYTGRVRMPHHEEMER